MGRGRPQLNAPRHSDLPELIKLWQAAAASDNGIMIPCANPSGLLQKLYKARREIGGFHEFKLVQGVNDVKIIKRTV